MRGTSYALDVILPEYVMHICSQDHSSALFYNYVDRFFLWQFCTQLSAVSSEVFAQREYRKQWHTVQLSLELMVCGKHGSENGSIIIWDDCLHLNNSPQYSLTPSNTMQTEQYVGSEYISITHSIFMI